MEKPEFIAGNESRFFDFISSLNDKDKIALISHNDMDGVASAKIADSVLKADIVKLVGYNELNDSFIDYLKDNKVKKVVFCDLVVNEWFIKEVEKFSSVLVIDHHLLENDYNSEKTIFLNAQGFCAAYICYYLFSKAQNLEHLDWLVACACVADFLYQKNRSWVEETYIKYGDKFEEEANYIRKSGKMWELQWAISLSLVYWRNDLMKVYSSISGKFGDIGQVKEWGDEVDGYLQECISQFDNKKEVIKGRYFIELKPKYQVGSIISTLLAVKYPSVTIIIAREDEKYYNLSARRNDGGENMDSLMKLLTAGLDDADGGGHLKAAGGHVQLKDKNEIKKRLGDI